MKIGIITYWTSNDNYGQLLQCYALQQVLKSMGHEPYLIRFVHGEKSSIVKKIKRHLSSDKIKCLFNSERRYNRQLRKVNLRQNVLRRFDEFRCEHIIASNRIYNGLQELRTYPPEADVYICGSDQVWRNSFAEADTPAWFLAFGNNQVRRISYAASIGRELEIKEIPIFKQFLSSLNKISVREESARLLCDSLGFNETQVTLDPTLLLPAENYRQIAKKNIPNKPYLFMYVLNVFSREEIYWNVVDTYLKQRDLEFKIVCSSGYIQARQLIEKHPNILATIPEWIGYIEYAQCVLTTSFHGVVFSIKMHKPFLAILLTNQFSKGNDRIISLLNTLNLSERIYNPHQPIKYQMEKIINWCDVESRLSQLQIESYNFLKSI